MSIKKWTDQNVFAERYVSSSESVRGRRERKIFQRCIDASDLEDDFDAVLTTDVFLDQRYNLWYGLCQNDIFKNSVSRSIGDHNNH